MQRVYFMFTSKNKRYFFVFSLSFILLGFNKSLPVYEGTGVQSINKNTTLEVGSTYTNTHGESRLGDLLWETQDDLADDILDALGDYKIQAKIVSRDFLLNGKNSSVTVGPEIRPTRIIRTINQGSLSNGVPSSDYRTQFMILDELTVSTKLNVKSFLDKNSNLNIFKNYNGVRIEKISYTNSLEDSLKKDTIKVFSDLANVNEMQAQVEAEQGSAEDQAPELAQKIYDDESKSKVRKISDKFSDNEKTKIFFEGFFDPYKVFAKFARLDIEKLKDDKILKPGEILIKTYFRKFGPGVGANKGLLSADFHHYTYRYFRLGFKKVAPGQILVKVELDEASNNEFNFGIGLPLISFEPERVRSTNGFYKIQEKLFSFNLNTPEGASQLSEVLGTQDKQYVKLADVTGVTSHIPHEYNNVLKYVKEIPGKVDLLMSRTKSSLTPTLLVTNRTETGFIGIRTANIKNLEARQTQTDEASPAGDEIIGQIQRRSAQRLRFFNFFQSNENKNRTFRLISRADASGATVTDLGFEYSFENTKTSLKKYKEYIQNIKNSLFGKLTENSVEAKRINDALDAQIANKADLRDYQRVYAGLYFSQDFVRRIISHKVADVQTLIAQLILKDNPTWYQITHLQEINGGALDCRYSLTQTAKDLLFGNMGVACQRITAVAQNLVATFMAAQKPGNTNAQVSAAFTELVKKRDLRPIVPRLMLAVGLLKNYNKDNEPQFESFDRAVSNGEVEINLSMTGKGINGVRKISTGSIETLEPYQYSKDFSLLTEEYKSGAPIITNASVFVDKSKSTLYVDFFSALKAQPGYKVRGVVYRYKALKADEPIAYIKATSLSSEAVLENGSNDILGFKTIIAFPFVKEVTPKQDHTIQFWIEDAHGNRMSQIFEVKFDLSL